MRGVLFCLAAAAAARLTYSAAMALIVFMP